MRRRFALQRGALDLLVDQPVARRPGIDDLGHDAGERRLRRHTAQLDDQLRDQARAPTASLRRT